MSKGETMRFIIILLFVLSFSFLMSSTLKFANNRQLEGEIVKANAEDVYFITGKNLLIIDKDLIIHPDEVREESYQLSEESRINYNSYQVIEVKSAEDLDFNLVEDSEVLYSYKESNHSETLTPLVLKNGKTIAGELLKIDQKSVFLVVDEYLFIIRKEFIATPVEYTNSDFTIGADKRVNFISYRIYDIDNAEKMDYHLEKREPCKRGNNCIYVEALGPCFLYSLNFERKAAERLFFRIGASYWHLKEKSNEVEAFLVPVSLATTIGKGVTKLEFGGGVCLANYLLTHSSFFFVEEEGFKAYGQLNLSVRIEPASFPVVIRLGYTPFFDGDEFISWGGISLGRNF